MIMSKIYRFRFGSLNDMADLDAAIQYNREATEFKNSNFTP